MARTGTIGWLAFAGLLYTVVTMGAATATAHCDGRDGPVVLAAQKALDGGDVNRVLIWVQKQDEAEVRKAFAQTLAVRKLSAEARELADTWFFETLVRIHRAGEGFSFTGLQPAGRDLGPAIPAGDRAVESGALDGVLKLLPEAAHDGARERFAKVVATKKFSADDVDAGREFVAAYVAFIHFVEAQYESAGEKTGGCAHETGKTPPTHGEHALVGAAASPAEAAAAHRHGSEGAATAAGDAPQIPAPLKAEHDALHAELVKAIEAGGKIGDAATAVANVLHPHFVEEEAYALPPLGLLSALARGDMVGEPGSVLAMTEKLKAELPRLVAEHKAIVAALERLRDAAKSEGNQAVAHFADKLILHAQTEEQVLYPAAILAGEYLRVRRGS